MLGIYMLGIYIFKVRYTISYNLSHSVNMCKMR